MYNNDEKALLWLNSFAGLSVKKKLLLLDLFMSPSEMFYEFKSLKDDILQIIDQKTYNQMAMLLEDSYTDKLINDLTVKKIKAVTIASADYPKKLKQSLDDPPIVLYYKGNLELVDTLMVAIVGARKVTRYGKDVTEKFSKELTLHGFTILSGLARGVDTIAHSECLANDGNTIAVLGCGIDVIYPKENKDLYEDIARKGLVLSEYPIGTEPYHYNFPQRNRIISALSDGVLVTEAGAKSGSIITANCALNIGKEVYAVPGNIFSEQSQGTNELIKNNNAAMILNINDILCQFNIQERKAACDPIQLDFVQQSIVNELAMEGKVHLQDLLSRTNMEISSLFIVLQGLINAKVIRQLPGNFYELQPK